MKLKDWNRDIQQRQPLPDLIKGNPIICPDCGHIVGYDKDYMLMVITTPIACPKCDEIVIYPNNITY